MFMVLIGAWELRIDVSMKLPGSLRLTTAFGGERLPDQAPLMNNHFCPREVKG